MPEKIETSQSGALRVFTISSPFVTEIAGALVSAFHTLGDEVASGASQTKGVLVQTKGAGFGRGSDVRALYDDAKLALARAACARIEASPVPVFAAVSGRAAGHWLELALSAHVRLANAQAGLVNPDISLGALPSLGTLSRIVSVVPTDVAARFMMGGVLLNARPALEARFFDALVDGADFDVAAQQMLAQKPELVASRHAADRAKQGAATDARAELAKVLERAIRARRPLENQHALERLCECLEAAHLLPRDAALAFEQEAFEELRDVPDTRGRIHAFWAKSHAGTPPPPAGAARKVDEIGLIGTNAVAAEVTLACVRVGLGLRVYGSDAEALTRFRDALRQNINGDVKRGVIAAEVGQAQIARVGLTEELEDLQGVPIVLDAMNYGLGSRAGFLNAISPHVTSDTIVATLNPFAELDEADGLLPAPAQTAVFHIPQPCQVTELVEIVPASTASGVSVATLFRLAEKLRKAPVAATPPDVTADALPETRSPYCLMFDALVQGAVQAVGEGADPVDVDRALGAWGLRRLPFRDLDLQGLRRYAGPRREVSGLVAMLIEAGRFGRASGAGFYAYDGASERVDERVDELVEAWAQGAGITPQEMSAERIVQLCTLAMANIGARLLRRGTLRNTGDVETLATAGLGFPKRVGGPLFSAEQAGLVAARKALSDLAESDPAWTPDPLWDDAIKHGQSFTQGLAARRANGG